MISPFEAAIKYNLQEQIKSVFQTLTPREERVLRQRSGIGEVTDHTLEEVGQNFEVTRERIRQIEAKALRKLRASEQEQTLKEFHRVDNGFLPCRLSDERRKMSPEQRGPIASVGRAIGS